MTAGERAEGSFDPLPVVYRVTFGLAVPVLSFAVLALPAAVFFTWLVHFRRLPDWLLNIVGVAIALVLLFSVWRITRFLSRRRYRFSLRFAMILTATFAVGLSILAHQLHLAQREHSAIEALWEDGSRAEYYLKLSEDSIWFCWLIQLFGHDPFVKVTELDFCQNFG